MINQSLLHQMLEQGYLRTQKHPNHNLWIYNYTATAQYEGIWNEVTLQCRGLILNENYEIVARPFPKFFNLGERQNQIIPNEPFEVYEKMDGSLGILYWIENEPFIATRGSFASEQSRIANQILYTRYRHLFSNLDKNKTYLFEIIYPENRIVVDYGDWMDLVLLAVIDNDSGEDQRIEEVGFTSVTRYDGVNDINDLKALEADNKEGFVVKFKSGLRYKIKFEEYVRIHRIITQVSTISIWEYLKTGQSFEEILERVPDEFYQWVKKTRTLMMGQYGEIEKQAKEDFKILESRKETALYFKNCPYPAVLFKMLDGRPYDEVIWKLLRPDFEKPFIKEFGKK